MTEPKPISFEKIIAALLDDQAPFSPRYLHRFSNLDAEDAQKLSNAWSKVSPKRRIALMEDLDEIAQADDLLFFEDVCRLAIKDTDAPMRLIAIKILREYELPDLISDFLNMMESDLDNEVRAAAASALGTYIYLGEIEELPSRTFKRIEERLLKLTQGSEAAIIRRSALEALGFSSRPEVPVLIEQAYDSKDIDWLMTALNAMGRSANRRWKTKVLAMLEHNQPLVRAEAAAAAGELELKAAVKPLLRMLHDSDLDVRMASIWALSQLAGEGVQSALENLLEKTRDEEEASLLESALDNLQFTEEMQTFTLLDLVETEDTDAEDDELYLDGDVDDVLDEEDTQV
jgi:HEAT repeat protein